MAVEIRAAAGVGGTITPSGILAVGRGSSITFTITPNAGYHVLAVNVDNVTVGAMGSYTFTNLQADHVIAVGFEVDANTAPPVDLLPPTAPTPFVGVSGVRKATLQWGPASDDVGVVFYKVDVSTSSSFSSYVSGWRGRVVGNVATVVVPNLTARRSYYFRVRAVDGAGRVGPNSVRVRVIPRAR